MTVLKVIEWPAKVLDTRAEEVTSFDESIAKLVGDMHETMQDANGIGLAANQVDELKRILVINIPFVEGEDEGEKQDWHDKPLTFINPVINKKNGRMKYMEGCLSFPGIFEYIDRAESILVSALDAEGKPFQMEADGLLSICLQHEIDHLDGVVFLKRMSRLKGNLLRKKLNKRQVTAP